MGIGEADAGGLDEEPGFLGVGRMDLSGSCDLLTEEGGCFFLGKNRFVRGPVQQAHAAFVADTDGANGLKDHRFWEMSRQVDSLTDRERVLAHLNRKAPAKRSVVCSG